MKIKTYEDYIFLEKNNGNIKFINISENNIPKNTTTKTKIKCINCNNIWFSTYGNIYVSTFIHEKTGCPKCKLINKRKGKTTYKNLLKIANINNVEIISKIDKNMFIKIKDEIIVKCKKCKTIWKSNYNKLYRKRSCKICSGKVRGYKDYLIVEKNNKKVKFINISENNIPATTCTLTLVKCIICNKKFLSSYNRVSSGRGCSDCYGNTKKTYEDYIKVAEINNVKIIDDITINNIPYSKNKFKVECNKCKNIFLTSYFYLSRNHTCFNCAHNMKTYEDYINLSKNKKYEFVNLTKDNIPKSTSSTIETKCNICNKIWFGRYYDLLNGCGCPNCCSRKGEKLLRCVFSILFKNIFIKVRPTWLKTLETKRPLELDGYCEKLNLAFEYNGLQHYRIIKKYKMTEEDLNKRKLYDKIKSIKCKERGINLIIINVFKKFTIDYIYDSIIKGLNKSCIKISNNCDLSSIIENVIEYNLFLEEKIII